MITEEKQSHPIQYNTPDHCKSGIWISIGVTGRAWNPNDHARSYSGLSAAFICENQKILVPVGDQHAVRLDFSRTTMRYIQGADIIRIRDGVARTMRLRSLPRHRPIQLDQPQHALLPRPDGTYLITGGLGALGLEVADFLITQTDTLRLALDNLFLPPIRGVVHAAGVLAPKITGGLVLNEVFPPQSVDFFILFSSCGQLVGSTGQRSYGAGNASLNTLATHRQRLGDRGARAFQWTTWRGLGMGASTDFISAELTSKGISDGDHAVVLRALPLEPDNPLPSPALADIVIRRSATGPQELSTSSSSTSTSSALNRAAIPTSGPELKTYLDQAIRGCVAAVLHLPSADEVDAKATLADLGVDSVMTVTLRQKLQQALKVKMPPTLMWSHPTVEHLVGWFAEKVGKD
ncbi:beta-ketoacyl reductase [Aspergillus saccharolyticus JOP 1030-1]|uniref:KR-domain-containing protein n=1 Tax=Aspergillus saccharolyticus JOP 1030-1 TaxID=1450539 RepID=A0A318ZKJ5_9EURO|nr:KR-domain-containing protein [Aspergillus saccharolyticus JOP 1030-1]PYH48089.1 KR-domain-containing protein [Aspergillus saccharolyticus JOP 1030-1]